MAEMAHEVQFARDQVIFREGDECGIWHEQSIPYRGFAHNVIKEVLWSWSGATPNHSAHAWL
jgi:hypothetical protein